MQIKFNFSSKVPSLILEIFTIFTNLLFGSELCLEKNIVNYFGGYILGRHSHSVLSNICIRNLSIISCLMSFSEFQKKGRSIKNKKYLKPKRKCPQKALLILISYLNNFSNLRFVNSFLKVFNSGEQEGAGSLKRRGKDGCKGEGNLEGGCSEKNISKRDLSKKGITKGGGM